MHAINSFLVLGGDKRQLYAAEYLAKQGYQVAAYGFEKSEYIPEMVVSYSNLKVAISLADAIVLPLPMSMNNYSLQTPLSDEEVTLERIFSLLEPEQVVFTGRITPEIAAMDSFKAVRCYDYFSCENLTIENAFISAEGAVQVAMEHLPKSLNSSKALIIGYGRIARSLVRILNGFGVDVTVAARKDSDRVWIKVLGNQGVTVDSLGKGKQAFDLVFNTVPSKLLHAGVLKNFDPNCLLIELASAPGGIDLAAARAMDFPVVTARGIPGIYAPQSAGEAIGRTILDFAEKGEA